MIPLNALKAPKKLYLLVFVMAVFIVGVGWYGTRELKIIHQQTHTLYTDRLIPMEQLSAVRFAYAVGILSTAHQVGAREISFQHAEDQLRQAERTISSNWNAYILTYLTSEEKERVTQAALKMERAERAIKNFKTALAKKNIDILDTIINNKLYPVVNPVIVDMNELMALQVRVSSEIYKEAISEYNTASKRFYSLIWFSLICAISFAFYVIGNIRRLIKDLRESNNKTTQINERYRSLLEHAGDPIFLLNNELSFIEANSSTTKLLGYSQEELLRMKIADVFAPGEIERLPLQLSLLLRNKALMSERKWSKKDETIIDIEMNVRLLDANSYLCIARDITERKRIEEAVRESERKYRNIFENAQDVFYQASLTGILMDVSPSVENHLGYKREELIGFSVREIYYDLSQRDKVLELVYSKGEVKDFELSFKSNKGEEVFVSLNARLIYDKNGFANHIDGMFRNITERKLAELELEDTLLQLENRVRERTKELSDKNISILDSIKYAKRIQVGLLTPPSRLAEIFPKSFMISVPCDIVSGDFFWSHEQGTKKIIIVADCTGHGVPGALMSIICNNLIDQIIINERVESPADILELLDTRLKQAVKNDEDEVKDGMDITICVIDMNLKEVCYAGANNSLYVTNQEGKVEENYVNHVSIGGMIQEEKKHFETKRFTFLPGQRIYLSSDGYYSQFGGERGKKFMKAGFEKTLDDLQVLPIEKQKSILLSTFTAWRGTNEQVDDVLIIGIEL
jgi:PAS domain S-box-containing protein